MAALMFDVDKIDSIYRAAQHVDALAELLMTAYADGDDNAMGTPDPCYIVVAGEMLQGEAAAIQAALAGLVKGGGNNA